LKNSTLLLNAIQESSIVKQESHQEYQVIQQESQVMLQESQQEFQVIQHKDFQITEHEIQVIQDEGFQNTQQVTQNNSSIMQEFNTTFTQVKSQVSHKNIHKKTKAYIQRTNNIQQIKTTKDTLPIEITKNIQHIKTTKDNQLIEITKNMQYIKTTKDIQYIENIKMTKDGTINIF
ncbi:14131_t:CDS:2, partial [Dentiscutata heterogama]